MGNGVYKQYLRIGRHPVLAHTLAAFEACDLVDSIIVVVPQGHVDDCWHKIVKRNRFSKVGRIVPGGKHRQDSVLEALEVVDSETGIVCIHDGVRPFIEPAKIAETIILCAHWDAVVVAVSAKDTIKTAERGLVKRTLDRQSLWCVQTPQTFDYQLIYTAYQRAMEAEVYTTDDSSLVERLGHAVKIVEGSYDNIKITTPVDLCTAKMILERRGSCLARYKAGG
jgi:2-C-methyl-D-erythritol 4-phosphate cytidylyltransferase